MSKIVISQPMFFPWVGLFEQVKLADIYVHYDDVQMPQGRSFTTRVQIKTPDGTRWLTAPVQRSGALLIKDIKLDNSQRWRVKHLKTLEQCYRKSPFFEEMIAIVKLVYDFDHEFLSDLNCLAIQHIADYFGLQPRFSRSSAYATAGHGSVKLLELLKQLQGDVYLTGHGALRYLDHELFEANGVRVEYIDYQKTQYRQLHGEFTPYVSILDLIANEGRDGSRIMNSGTVYWKDFSK